MAQKRFLNMQLHLSPYLVILLIFLLSTSMLSQSLWLHSDHFYFELLFRDLTGPFSLNGWKLTPAPYFFPDMALFFPIRAIFTDYRFTLFLYALTYSICLFYLWKNILNDFLSSAAVFSLLLIFTLCEPTGLLMQYAFPSSHGGLLLTQAFCLLSFFKNLGQNSVQRKPSYFAFTGIIVSVALQIASDLFFLVQTWIPLLLTLFIGWKTYSQNNRKTAISFFLSLVIGLVASVGVKSLLLKPFFQTGLNDMNEASTSLSVAQIANELYRIGKSFSGKNFVLLILPILYLAYGGIKLWHNKRNSSHASSSSFYVFYVVSAILTLGAIAAKNLWINEGSIRYIFPFLILPFCGFGLLIKPPKTSLFLKASLPTLLVVLFYILFQRNLFKVPHLEYPEEIKCVDKVTSQYQRSLGLGDYWVAKTVSAYSRNGVWINQLSDQLQPLHWINNKNWYSFPENTGNERSRKAHNFILIRKKSPIPIGSTFTAPYTEIEKKFGKPEFTEDCGNLFILLYPKDQDLLKIFF